MGFEQSLFHGRFWLVISLLGCMTSVLVIEPARARQVVLTKNISSLSEIKLPQKSASMLVQATPMATAASEVVQVTGVKVNPTSQGLEVILETSGRKQLQVLTSSYGRTFVANIVNAQLALPEGKEFRALDPATGITAVTVTQQTANSIRVSVTGKTTIPTARVIQNENALALSLSAPVDTTTQPPQPTPAQPPPAVSETVQSETPTKPGEITPAPVEPQQPVESIPGEEEIEIVVTGDREDGYSVPNASTATRTDTPLRDIPQSIEVVPQEVLRDQNVTRLEDALRNVSGVTQAFSLPSVSTFTIRGFRVDEGSGSNFLRDGLPDPAAGGVAELPNIERIEVLKGPASVLYGFGNPGGTINLVTKQPLRDPFYEVEATVGNYDFYRGLLDFSGPLNDSKTVLYRLNASYRNSGSFIDFFDSEYLSFSPVISLNFGEKTDLFLEGEYIKTDASFYSGVPLIGSVRSNPNGKISRNRNFGEPSDQAEQTVSRIGYRLEHKFSENWSLRNAFRATFRDYSDNLTIPTGLNTTNNRTLNRFYRDYELEYENYSLTTYLTGKFSTGSINHQVVFGVDLNRFDIRTPKFIRFNAQPLDIFAPMYRQPLGNITNSFRDIQVTDSLGIYIQDQIALAENFKLLLGGRFDTFSQRYEFLTDGSESSQSESAFSPRLGIVYQLIPAISLYASYARSFTPANGTGFLNTNLQFQPERGTQYEVGVKADLSDRLAATLAFYGLTRTNVLIDDPINQGFRIQTGKQRSRGIELNIAGEILPGWSIIAGYAYTDAQITEDENAELVGNQLNNTPENAFNLWTTYEIQAGDLQGLGFGLGLFFVGDRPGNLANTFEIPSYLRTDAAIFYNRDRFRAALNFRNLFDINYFDFALNPARLHYGQPFTVEGTISWEF